MDVSRQASGVDPSIVNLQPALTIYLLGLYW